MDRAWFSLPDMSLVISSLTNTYSAKLFPSILAERILTRGTEDALTANRFTQTTTIRGRYYTPLVLGLRYLTVAQEIHTCSPAKAHFFNSGSTTHPR